ncbi:MAG TPA: methyltransferase domain-containing protein [Gemmatimonadales bacterium]|nr:methyltransferase domain-containing protein [Gemmatimonadales bacterium]
MPADVWADGDRYELYVGRWSRLVAPQFVRWLDLPAQSAWLDFGCGTGALTGAIFEHADPRLVIGCDRSPSYVDFAARRMPDARARFVVAELSDLPGTEGGFDACVAGLVLNFLPDPRAGIEALMSRARPGVTIAGYVWDYAEGMELMRVFWDAAVALDPAARALDEGRRFPLCRPEPLRRLYHECGLRDVAVREIDVPTEFPDFDDYWRPFLGGQGPAPTYAMRLSPERRGRLEQEIRRRMGVEPDGRIRLTARAWAFRGATA